MIAVLGSVNMDLVLEAERIPRPGDAFNGALAWALRERPLAEAIRYAVAAGSIATTRKGASPSLPSLAELLAVIGKGR